MVQATRGGQLTLTATATTSLGQPVQATSSKTLWIKGQSSYPPKDVVQNYIKRQPVPGNYPPGATLAYQQVLIKIATWESLGKMNQFICDGTPLYCGKGDGGTGIMQLTPPGDVKAPGQPQDPTTADERTWNWLANVDKGATTFNDKIDVATNYFHSLQTQYQSPNYRQKLNAMRNANLASIVVPYVPDQLVKDAIHGYGPGGFTTHEFTLLKASDGELDLNVVEGKGTAQWQDAKSAYVSNVLGP